MPGESRNLMACTSGVGCGPEASKPVTISGNARYSFLSNAHALPDERSEITWSANKALRNEGDRR